MSSSSNSNLESANEYEFVKTLVRDLHITKNVSRPDGHKRHATNIYTNNNKSRAAIHMSDAEKLLLNQLDDNNRQSSVSDIEELYNEGDDVGRSNESKRKIHNNELLKKNVSSSHHQSNCSLNIPSVVITDANEHIDLFSSTQRRFSQLYSGLRRFSTSHTVWKQWILWIWILYVEILLPGQSKQASKYAQAREREEKRHLMYRPHKWMSFCVNRILLLLTHQHRALNLTVVPREC